MAGDRAERRLTAILAADVAGYSRLMGADEEGTLTQLKAHRCALVEPKIIEHRGRIVKTAGDGILVEFASVVDALRCAVEIQSGMAERNANVPQDRHIEFRMGIHQGDIIVDGEDIFGDGVNVAARLERLADPGGICVSGRVQEDVRGKLEIMLEDIGEQQLKNIAWPLRIYRVHPSLGSARTIPAPLAPSDKLSIAVLPFRIMSGDPEQEYFADGIAEDILITLSKIQELLVIARNSSFVFKGQARDIREIGKLLGARYVLEGSVRKAGSRVRLAAQLIDSTDGSHLWGDRFEGELNDVFDLQDRITQEIVAALSVRLTFGEEARVWCKRSGSPLVYEHFLKARNLYTNFAKQTHAQARNELEKVLGINPTFTPALYLLGLTLTDQARFGWDPSATYGAALDCAAQALETDPGCGEAHSVIGYVRTFQRRHGEAIAAGERAIALCPSSTTAYHMAGMYHGYAGDFRTAVRYEEHAQRLSPMEVSVSKIDEARARFHLGEFAAARDIALRVLAMQPRWLTAATTLVAALWKLGSEEEARRVAQGLIDRHPSFSVRRWATTLPYRRLEDLDGIIVPLRLAGLPD